MSKRTQRRTRTARNAFTLLELLIVIGIVAALVAITTLVGSAVIDAGKKKSTLGVLHSLDEALAAYIDAKGDNPPALVPVDYSKLTQDLQNQYSPGDVVYYPAVDGRGRESTSGDLQEVNSVAYFIESANAVAQSRKAVDSIHPQYIRNYTPDNDIQPFLRTAFDAWGNPIRYVHPKFDGIIERAPRGLGDPGEPVNIINPNKPFFQPGALPLNAAHVVRLNFVRRNFLVSEDFRGGGSAAGGGLNQQSASDFDLVPDSDGGLTTGNRPYFYSAGPDGDPSTLDDNIYITPVQHADPGVN